MFGALFDVGSSVLDSPNVPCLCLDAHARTSRNKKKILGSSAGSSFTGSGIVLRLSSKRVPRIATRRSKRRLLIVNEDVAGNYDDTFGDVKTVRFGGRSFGMINLLMALSSLFFSFAATY